MAADDSTGFTGFLTLNDTGSLTDYRTNSPAGEYGFLYTTTGSSVGLIYYQAGIAVITGAIFGGDRDQFPSYAATNPGLFGPPSSASYGGADADCTNKLF